MFIDQLTRKELELRALVELGAPLWLPDADNAPQLMAYLSDAHTIGFGGAAGGGKTDLIVGKALNQHSDSMIMRRVGTELQPVIDRILALRGTRDGYAGGNQNILRMPERNQTIEFASVPNLGDETKYQGHPNDFKAYDEATNFLVAQVRFLQTWLRNTRVPGQVCQQMHAFNPPQTAEGRWVIDYYAPWLDREHRDPAAHGELRYFVTVGRGTTQRDVEVPNRRCVIIEGEPVFDFDESEYEPIEIITPQSRTFIASKVTDNKYQNAEYMANLQSLPEPLRSQMLNGDFYAGLEDSEWQVCPTAWVEAAMKRWAPRERKTQMHSVGVDVARGGSDNTILARRHDNWFDEPLVYPGKSTPDGPMVMGLIAAALRDDAAVHVDIVGVGSSPFDFLKIARFRVAGVNGGEKSIAKDKSGRLGFKNMKSQLWWRMREALDPANNVGLALPPDKQLLRDLTAPTWKPEGPVIKVESRLDIIKRIGRSPDWGSAYVLGLIDTPAPRTLQRADDLQRGHDPMQIVGHDPFRS